MIYRKLFENPKSLVNSTFEIVSRHFMEHDVPIFNLLVPPITQTTTKQNALKKCPPPLRHAPGIHYVNETRKWASNRAPQLPSA